MTVAGQSALTQCECVVLTTRPPVHYSIWYDHFFVFRLFGYGCLIDGGQKKTDFKDAPLW